MDINNIGRVMEKIDFPKEAVRRFGGLAKTIVGNGGIFEKWNGIKAGYMAERISVGDALEQLSGIGDIYLVGHGMGGALAPRIAQQSGGRIAGIVSLAGTARPYLDVVYEQTLAMTDDASRQSAIKKEYKKADKLDSMKDSDTIFGVPVPYIRDLYDYPVAQSLAALDVPVFIAQGKDDFQTSLEDYKSWQSALEGYAGETRFALYDGLNHLFAENGGVKGRGTSAEYLAELHVSDQLLDDRADWVAQCTGK